MRIASGVVDQYIYFVAVDSTDLRTRETGLSSFTVVRSRNGAADVTYTTPTVTEIDASSMPGVYALLLDEDMTIDSGDETQEICLHITQASMAPVTRVFELYRPKITAGETLSVSSSALASIAANVITASVMAADSIGASEVAADVVTEIAAAIIAELGTRGSAASASISASSTDVDVANNALDMLVQSPITAFTDGTPEADWLTRQYGITRDGEMRDFTWKFAKRRRKLYPLDFAMAGITGTLSGAWGFLRLTEDYSGELVTIRRSSDDTTDDFSWGEDVLSVDADAIETFVGSGNSGYVSQLWDQTGNGRHLVQATSAQQPLFTAEIETGDEDRPGASFDGSNDLLATSAALSALISTTAGYIVVVGLIDTLTLNSATASSNHVILADSAKEHGLFARLGGILYGVNDDGSEDSVTDALPSTINSEETPKPFVAELRHASGTLYTRVNMGDEESATSGTTSSLAGSLNIGDIAAGSQALDFKLFAVLTFSTAPDAADRDRLVSRLMRWVDAGGMGDFGWTYRYKLPSNCVRVIRITTDGKFEGPMVEGEVEDGYFLTNQGAPLYLLYAASGLDASYFDPLFKEALSAKLAMKGAHFFTGKTSYLQLAQGAYDNAIKKAKRAGSIEGSHERSNDPDVIQTRI